jgi:hypothetical protein
MDKEKIMQHQHQRENIVERVGNKQKRRTQEESKRDRNIIVKRKGRGR